MSKLPEWPIPPPTYVEAVRWIAKNDSLGWPEETHPSGAPVVSQTVVETTFGGLGAFSRTAIR